VRWLRIGIADARSYLTGDGRISVAGITPANVRRLAEALHAVTSKKNKL